MGQFVQEEYSQAMPWNQVVKLLEPSLGAVACSTWIKPMRLLRQEGTALILAVPNRFFLDWVTENYLESVNDAVRKTLGPTAAVNFVVLEQETVPLAATVVSANNPKPPRKVPLSSLNHLYSFERFVVASCNQLAHAAAMSVAEQPARNYNPLFIYSDVGLGKSHLLNAIGIHCSTIHQDFNVTYVSAQDFVNDIIAAIRQDKMSLFRDKCRHIDCLLVDDVQFIAGKTSTEEEFFHMFNMLHGAGKQIVLTCDKFPKDIANLAERLRSRFQWGLIADIQYPDIETKAAITVKKATESGVTLSYDVAYFISSVSGTNIRELEGCLRRVLAYASIKGKEVSVDLAREALRGVYRSTAIREIKIEEIVKIVAGYYNVKVTDLRSPRKNKNITTARQVAMFLARKLTGLSFPDIGEKIGGRDHSTVIHGVNKVQLLIANDPAFKASLKELETMIVEAT